MKVLNTNDGETIKVNIVVPMEQETILEKIVSRRHRIKMTIQFLII